MTLGYAHRGPPSFFDALWRLWRVVGLKGITVEIAVDCDLSGALMARPVEVSLWGAVSSGCRAVTLLPPVVHGDLLRVARSNGISVAEYLRLVLFVSLYGLDEVERRRNRVLSSMHRNGPLIDVVGLRLVE